MVHVSSSVFVVVVEQCSFLIYLESIQFNQVNKQQQWQKLSLCLKKKLARIKSIGKQTPLRDVALWIYSTLYLYANTVKTKIHTSSCCVEQRIVRLVGDCGLRAVYCFLLLLCSSFRLEVCWKSHEKRLSSQVKSPLFMQYRVFQSMDKQEKCGSEISAAVKLKKI